MTGGAFIPVRRDFARLLGRGRNDAAALLTRIVYFQRQKGRAVYFEERDALETLNLTRASYRTARRHLREIGLLTEEHGFRFLVHFRIDLDDLDRRLAAAGLDRADDADDEIRSPECVDLTGSGRQNPSSSYLNSQDSEESSERGPFAQTQKDARKTASPVQGKKALETVEVHRSWAATDCASETVAVPVRDLHRLADHYRETRWPKQEQPNWTRLRFVSLLREGVSRGDFEAALAYGFDALEDRDERYVPNLGHWIDNHFEDALDGARYNAQIRRERESASPPPAAAPDHRHEAAGPVHAGVEAARRLEAEFVQALATGGTFASFNPFADLAPGGERPGPARPSPEAESPPPRRSQPWRPEPEAEPPLPPGARRMTWAEHLALQDEQRAERAARRAARYAARGRAAPDAGVFA